MGILSTCFCLSLLQSQVIAAPLIYSEAINGDINDSTVFDFDTGANTISGSFTWAFTGSFPNLISDRDNDNFRYTLPDGVRVDDVSFSIDNVQRIGSITTEEWSVSTSIRYDEGFGSVGTDRFDIPGVELGTDLFADEDINGSFDLGTNNMGQFTLTPRRANTGTSSALRSISFDWTFELQASELDPSPVPLPGALPLFVCGLVGIAKFRRPSV